MPKFLVTVTNVSVVEVEADTAQEAWVRCEKDLLLGVDLAEQVEFNSLGWAVTGVDPKEEPDLV